MNDSLVRVAAVMVSFNPPAGLAERLRQLLGQVATVILVDNGSGPEAQAELDAAAAIDGVRVVQRSTNLGLAAALNLGVAEARERGFALALLLDHDSTPASDMVEQLLAARQGWRGAAPLAAVAPRVVHERSALPTLWFLRPSGQTGQPRRLQRLRPSADTPPTALLFTIGSGLLVDSAGYQALGGMSEALFIDAVDTDYCLRAHAAGQIILGVPQAVLLHRLGDVGARRRFAGKDFWPMNHSARRHYFIARNRIHLLRRHARRQPGWLELELRTALMLMANVVLFERQRPAKLAMMLRGTLAGLLRHDGPFPE